MGGDKNKIARLTKEEIDKVCELMRDKLPMADTCCDSLGFDSRVLHSMVMRGARDTGDELDRYAFIEVKKADAQFQLRLASNWAKDRNSQSGDMLSTLYRKYDRNLRQKLDNEIHNIIGIIRRTVDPDTFLAIVDAIEFQDKELGIIELRDQKMLGTGGDDSE
jgi:hypothetical protein